MAEVPVEEVLVGMVLVGMVLVGMVMAVAGVPVMPAFHEHDVAEDDFHQLARPSLLLRLVQPSLPVQLV